MQTKTLSFYLFLGLCLLSTLSSYSQELPTNNNAKITAVNTLKETEGKEDQDVLLHPSSLAEEKHDTINKVKIEKESLTDKITYKASDYERISQREKKIYLYNEAEVVYGDMRINAGEIILDYETNTVFARGIKDSTGTYSQIPLFEQGVNKVKPDSIKFNFKTQRALIYGSRVEQAGGQEINLKSEISKRVNDSVFFMKNVKITTAKDIDNPEYYFYARKVKFVPGKKLVAGLINMYIADIPTPIGLPFALFPLEKKRSVSGFIIPSPGETRQRGYSLQNGGYYFALSDYYDLAVTGDYYTNGSYALRADSNYKLRYKFNGQFSFNFERILASERGFPDFSERSTYNIRWNHSQDPKSSPNSRFSASVNLGSSDFFQQSLNQSNTGNFLNNNFSSSISYSKTFTGTTPVNLTVASTHSQNSNTEIINLSLPTAQLNVDRIYPFAPKTGSKKGIIQNINVNYAVRADNRYTTTDSLFFRPEMFRNGQSGVRHTIPVATNFKVLKHISASVNANYTESWVFKTIDRFYDQELQENVTDTINGFDSFRTYSTGASLGTTLYGIFNFKQGKKIQTIRHVVRPSVGINYTPSFDRFIETFLQPDPTDPLATTLTDEVEFSRFDNGFFAAPGGRESASVSLSLNNVVEAKVRSRDSTATELKKISILNNLNFRTSYNIASDSLRLSPIAWSGSLPIIQDKLDINFSGAWDIYALDSSNRRVNTLNINNGGSLFRLTSARANFGYNFSSKNLSKKKDPDVNRTNNQTFASGGRPDDLLGTSVDITGRQLQDDDQETQEEDQKIEFYNFKIPWALRLSYDISYANSSRQNEINTHSLVFSGDVDLGSRWKVGGSSGYDLRDSGFTFTSLRFSRDLESWNMSFNWNPPVNSDVNRVGWNFFIGITGNLLSDIKYDKRRAPDER